MKVTLLDKVTGKTKAHIDEYENAPTLEDSFMWTEGNYSCDCNRGLFFYDDSEDFDCGEERFLVVGWEKIESKEDK